MFVATSRALRNARELWHHLAWSQEMTDAAVTPTSVEPIPAPDTHYELVKQNFPAELRSDPAWMCFRVSPSIKHPGKLDKTPYSARTGRHASSDNPQTWCSFERALSYAKTNKLWMGYAGKIAVKCDLDGVTTEDGSPSADAVRFMDTVGSYWERSVSGTGFHGFPGGVRPEGRTKVPPVEMYKTQMILVTGDVLPGRESFANNQAGIDAAHAEWLGAEPEQPAPPPSTRPTATYAGDDKELLEKARKSRQGPAFTALYDRGDAGPYDGDQSAADLALCNMLAFWYGGDAFKIDAMFRDSALMRPKWDERHYSDGRTYGQATIAKALGTVRDRYDPTYRKEITEDQRKDWEIATLKESIKRKEERATKAEAERDEARAITREVIAISRRDDFTHAMRSNVANVGLVMVNLDQGGVSEGVAHRRPMASFAKDTGSSSTTVRKSMDLLEFGLGRWEDAEGNPCAPEDEGAQLVPKPLIRRTLETEYHDGQRREVSYIERTPESGATVLDFLRAVGGLVAIEPRKASLPNDEACDEHPEGDLTSVTETWAYETVKCAVDGKVLRRNKTRRLGPVVKHGRRLADGRIDWLQAETEPDAIADEPADGPAHAKWSQVNDEHSQLGATPLSMLVSSDIYSAIPREQVPQTNSLGLPELFPPPPSKRASDRRCAKCTRSPLPGSVYCETHDYLLLGGPPPRRKEPSGAQAGAFAQTPRDAAEEDSAGRTFFAGG